MICVPNRQYAPRCLSPPGDGPFSGPVTLYHLRNIVSSPAVKANLIKPLEPNSSMKRIAKPRRASQNTRPRICASNSSPSFFHSRRPPARVIRGNRLGILGRRESLATAELKLFSLRGHRPDSENSLRRLRPFCYTPDSIKGPLHALHPSSAISRPHFHHSTCSAQSSSPLLLLSAASLLMVAYSATALVEPTTKVIKAHAHASPTSVREKLNKFSSRICPL
jgi:hypothetical protein